MEKITIKFAESVESFYEKKDRDQGYIEVKDRSEVLRKFDLLGVSAGILLIENSTNATEEKVVAELSKLKKSAKMMSNHVSWASFLP